MAATCQNCGITTPEPAPLCAACGWNAAAQKITGRPAGADLLFKPSAPEPAPVEFVDSHAPEAPPPPPPDPFAEITRKKASDEPVPPDWIPPKVLEAINKNEKAHRLMVAALRDPRDAGMKAALALLFVIAVLRFIFRPPPPAPPAPPPPPESTEYVRPAATFSSTPKVVLAVPDAVPVLPTSTAAPAAVPPAPAPAR